MRRTVFMLLFIGLLIGGAQAQTAVSWNGGSGNWNTPGDWGGGVVPNNGGGKTYAVTISNGEAETVTLNLDVTVSDLTLGTSATLQSAASDSLTIASGGTLTNIGTINFDTTGSNITVGSGGSLVNNGTLNLETTGEVLSVTGTTTNAAGASIQIEGGSAATFTGNVTNSGSFETGFSGGGNTVTVSGTFTNNAGATLELDSSGDVASINALNNSGTVTLASGSTLTITGGGNGVTDVVAGSTYNINGTFNVKNGSTTTSAFAKLGGIEGTLSLNNGLTTAITPASGTLSISNTGNLGVQGGTSLLLTGNLTNAGAFSTGFSSGGNTVSVSGAFTNSAGATASLDGSGDVLNVASLNNSGNLTINSGTTLNITGGGQGVTDVVADSTLSLDGALNVKNSGKFSNGLGNLTTVAGTLSVNDGITNNVTPNGGTLTIASGGSFNVSDGLASTTTLAITGNVNNSGTFSTGFSGGTNTINVSGTFTNNSGAVVTIYGGSGVGPGTDAISVATLTNSGTVLLGGTGSTLDITGSGTLTNSGSLDVTQGTLQFTGSTANFTGGGTVTLGNSSGTETGAIQVGSKDTGTLTNTNNTITGYGNLGNGTLTLVNKGTIVANGAVSTGALTVQPGSGAMMNSGMLEASNQGTLILEGTFNNTGGTIEALGENGASGTANVQLMGGTVINGGTLTTTTAGSNSGLIEGMGSVTLNGVTNSGTYAVNAGTTTTLLGTILNSGNVTLSASTLSLGNSVTLSGKGAIVLSNSASNLIAAAGSGFTLTNGNTIEGAGTIQNMGIVNTGTISANQSAPLIILPSTSGINNKGTLSVSAGDTMKIGTSAGGALLNISGTTLNGGTYTVNGTLEFGASGTSVVTDAANIALTGSGAQMIDFAGQNILANLATVTSAGSFTIGSGANFTTVGNFTNNGKITVNTGSAFKVTGSLTNFGGSTLTGGTYTVSGKLEFAGANVVTDAANLTISGSGEIENSTTGSNGLKNLATIDSSGSLTLSGKANFTTAGSLTDSGRLTVSSGSTLTVTNTLTNFNSSTNTLSSGTYTVGGTLEFTGANIVNNAANLTISGPSGKILNGTSNGLANFANNTGVFTLTANGSLTTGSANFTNSDAMTVASGSTLTVGGNDSYTQSAGTTTIDGTLSAGGASGITVSGGTILGAGRVNANVTVGGSGTAPTIYVGDTGKAGLLIITGTYSQLSSGSMNAFIGGTTVGSQYSQLQVTSSATLAGTLTVALASGFTPTVGSTFTVLTASSISGTFANSTIAINGSEHFNVTYTSTGVVLTVASSAVPQSNRTAGLSLFAGRQRRQPVLHSGLMQPIVGSASARFDGVLPPTERFGSYKMPIGRLSSRSATSWPKAAIMPVRIAEPGVGRVTNNWSGVFSGASMAKPPAARFGIQHVQVRPLPTALLHLAR